MVLVGGGRWRLINACTEVAFLFWDVIKAADADADGEEGKEKSGSLCGGLVLGSGSGSEW